VAKRKKPQPWDVVFDQVRVCRNPGFVYQSPSTEAELNEVELQLGSPLPADYRAFMTRFGSGRLMDWIDLYSPTPVQEPDFGLVVPTLHNRQAWKKRTGEYPRIYSNAELLCRAVYFAADSGGNAYVWGPQEETQHGYRFYSLVRDVEDNPAHVGDSFAEFLAWTEQYVRSWSDSEKLELLGPNIQFVPKYLRGKKPPLKRDVKLWLAFNNNTARDLALAIRDRGQTDAFPILADALQEAGCTNADLLDSCRTGDPDIDGKWVLQVLLGRATK
jgi:hypothetical protein